MSLVKTGAIVYGVVKVVGFLTPAKPGGDVPPATGDTRPATLSPPDADLIAEALAIAFYGDTMIESIGEDEEEVIRCMKNAQVTNDVFVLANAFGYRGPWLSQRNLFQAIQAYLEPEDKAAINTDYAAKRITIRF